MESVIPGPRPNQIWMVGDIFLTAVYRRAKSGPLGLNLGLDKQTCALNWVHHSQKNYVLFQKLEVAKKDLLLPDILFFHFSPNLECLKMNFSDTFKRDLDKVAEVLPNAELIVSALLPMPGHQMASLQLPQKKFNATLGAFVKNPHFHLFEHTQLEEMLSARFSNKDKELLREAEADLFITAVREVLQKAMCEDWKPVIEKCWAFCTAAIGSKRIWIVGDGFMNLIKSQAEASPLGLNLGIPKEICDIHWWMESETWFDLFPKLETAVMTSGRPDVLLFHLGSKDLCNVAFPTVISHAQDCFNDILRVFPNIMIILSTLLPKSESRESRVELRRKAFNHNLIICAKQSPYHLLSHEELEKKLTDRYDTGDLNPLTEAEAKGFLQSIKNVLQQTVLKDYRPSVAECELLPPEEVQSEEVQSEGIVKGPDQPSTSKEGDSAVTRPKEIWIIGNSYIKRASLRAKKELRTNLGLDEKQWVVRWMKTIRLFTLLNDLHDSICNLGMPSIVFLHVGSNDLGLVPTNKLIDLFMYDISQLFKCYPQTQFIFSAILPRPEWMWNGIEPVRRRLNEIIFLCAKKHGFQVASNRDMEQMFLNVFHQNQVSSTFLFWETGMLLSNIMRSIQEAMLKVSGPVTENKEPQKELLSTEDTLVVVVPGTKSATSTEDDDKAVEKEKTSDCLQPATKVETSEESVASQVDAPLPSDSESKQIWIVGNSYICRAAEQAGGSCYGFNLGFKPRNWTVHWMGRDAMCWEVLLSELNNALSTLGVPSIVFIHLGDNDVASVPYDTLKHTIEHDLNQIITQFPKTEFIFSTMLPKAEWLTNSLEQRRQEFNSALIRYTEELGFPVVIYEGIEQSAMPRFNNGGSNVISDAEYDLFVKSIKDALEMIVLKLEKAQTV